MFNFNQQFSNNLPQNLKQINVDDLKKNLSSEKILHQNFLIVKALDELSNSMTEFKKQTDEQHIQLKDVENAITLNHHDVNQIENQKNEYLEKANKNLTQLNIYFSHLDNILKNQKNHKDCQKLFLMSHLFYFINEVNYEILKIEKNNQLISYDQMQDELKRQRMVRMELSQKYQVIYSGVQELVKSQQSPKK